MPPHKRNKKTKNNFIKILYCTVLVLIITGLARPRLVDNLRKTSVSVIDMLLVLDISSSMLADDFSPNRLEAVKKTAGDFIQGRKEDRIGILVFAGESFIQCPLTVDKSVLKSLTKDITIASKEYDGTAIGMAVANGTNRLRKSDVESKVMILLSDGSNNAGGIDPKTAINNQENKVKTKACLTSIFIFFGLISSVFCSGIFTSIKSFSFIFL